jgi:putative addiction module component (TIGR02574 family)
MRETTRAILAAALSLPESERTELVDALLEYASPPYEWHEMTEEEFRAELDRRRQESLDGTDPGIPWPEVQARALKEIEGGTP